MEMQELEITIRQDGTVNVAVKGVTGARCLAVTKGLEQAVGTLTERKMSAAFYEEKTVNCETLICKGKVRADRLS